MMHGLHSHYNVTGVLRKFGDHKHSRWQRDDDVVHNTERGRHLKLLFIFLTIHCIVNRRRRVPVVHAADITTDTPLHVLLENQENTTSIRKIVRR